MATQRVLQVYDVLDLIFASFRVSTDERPFGVDRARRGDLARAARVCTAFFLPAVKLLWERMYDLLPLFKIFEGLHLIEGDVSEKGSSHSKELIYHFCSPISPQEWSRYMLYSQCIKSASFRARIWKIHPSALEYMSKTNGGSPLLPAVQYLEWEQASPLDFSMNKFISSTMRVFTFMYCRWKLSHGSSTTTDNATEFHVKLLFDELSVNAHSLEQITIYGIDHLSSVLSFSICNRLCKIHLSVQSKLDPAVLIMLASFKSLTELTLYGFNMGCSTSFVHFVALKRLCLSSDVDSLTHFFKSVLLPGIQSLKVAAPLVEDLDSSRALLASIAERCAETLSGLDVSNHSGNPVPGTDGTFITLVKPLFRMRHLHSVDFDLDEWSFPLSDQDMRELAEAWPKLSAIDLGYNAEPQAPHLYSLLHFATLCPELKSIHIASLLTNPLPDLDPYPILSHCLQSISFDSLMDTITNPGRVALFLDRIFPNIDVAKCEWLGEEEFSGADWQEVFTHLSHFQLVRSQQDIRAGQA